MALPLRRAFRLPISGAVRTQRPTLPPFTPDRRRHPPILHWTNTRAKGAACRDRAGHNNGNDGFTFTRLRGEWPENRVQIGPFWHSPEEFL